MNWPGHSAWSLLSNVAFNWIVPVVWSIWLLISSSVPWLSFLLSARLVAATVSVPCAICLLILLKSSSGRVNSTEIGSSCVTTTRPVVLVVCTMLPASIRRTPVRPARSAR